ncbi:hypothetical protein [Streptomyces sp. NPDC005244]|uniref:hypothetical protein n=1 Tax=Streptomyces sp. NPDC005244 TaxID=3364708 RepID=UPI00367A45F9
MGADTVIALAATAIALASFWVSYSQTKAVQSHNRQSVRPLLHVRRIKIDRDGTAGLQLTNAGLGPAIVTYSRARIDGEVLGEWNYHSQERLASGLPVRPGAHSMRQGAVLTPGQSVLLVYLEEFREEDHLWFWELITRRLVIEVGYESLYGGEKFLAAPPAF